MAERELLEAEREVLVRERELPEAERVVRYRRLSSLASGSCLRRLFEVEVLSSEA